MGDEFSQYFSNLYIYVEKWVGYSYWKPVSNVTSYLTGSYFGFVFLNSYYDSSNSTYPIQQYIDYHKEFYIDPSVYRYGLIELSKTDIVYLNGTNQTIYETENYNTYSTPATSTYIGYIGIVFGPKRYLIQEYLHFQPATSRMLDTTNSTQVITQSESQAAIDQVKEESSPQQILLSIFNFFAKVGGFCYFMKIVFGSAANWLANKLMKIEIINKPKSSRIKLDRRKSKQNCIYVRELILKVN